MMPGLTLLFAVLGSAAFPQQAPLSPPSPPAAARILVMPFENTQPKPVSPGSASLAMCHRRAQLARLAAITLDERVQAFEHLHLPVALAQPRTVIKVAVPAHRVSPGRSG